MGSRAPRRLPGRQAACLMLRTCVVGGPRIAGAYPNRHSLMLRASPSQVDRRNLLPLMPQFLTYRQPRLAINSLLPRG